MPMKSTTQRQMEIFDLEEKPRKKRSGALKKRSSGKSGSNRAPKSHSGTASSTPARKKASRGKASGSAGHGTKQGKSASKRNMSTQNTKAGKKNIQSKKRNTVQENPLARRSSAVLLVENESARRSSAAAEKRRPKSVGEKRPNHRKHRRKSSGGFAVLSAFLLMMILSLAGVGVWRTQEYRALAEMKEEVSRQTFFEGTTVDGIELSGMTLQQALEYWDTQVEPAYRQAAVVLDDGTQVTAQQLGYTSNYADILNTAWNAGRSGSLVQRYRKIQAAKARPASYEVSRTLYDDALVQNYVATLAVQINAEPEDAKVKSFNVDSYAFEFEPEKNGYKLDQGALVRDIETALSAGGGNVQMQIETLTPEVTLENVSSQYGMISYAITNASSSKSNRLENIRLSLEMINGTCLEPGETFSFNEVVGERTTERGFKVATAYSSGKVTEEVGGGICQVSTTLFNAVVKADLEINERHSHSLTVSYVDLGKDAAVDWGNKDLKFTNNSDDRVYICCYLTEDKRVRVGVFGRMLENGETITLEGVRTGTVDYDTKYQMNLELYSGQTRVVQNGKQGYTATTYKIWWDAQGNEIRREELCKSRYQATDEIIEYGP